jgi:DNA-directed RNA polymerase subunit RPC12/RpoP
LRFPSLCSSFHLRLAFCVHLSLPFLAVFPVSVPLDFISLLLGEPANFLEFVAVREQSGEDLRLHKAVWSKDKTSNICQLCSDQFSLTNRRHHCRACGVLTCDKCSSKRLHLSVQTNESSFLPTSSSSNNPNERSTFLSNRDSGKKGATGDRGSLGGGGSGKEDNGDRVCDGCFNRLCQEASQPSPDHFRVRQLKQCAIDLIHSIEELIDSLDDPGSFSSCCLYPFLYSLFISCYVLSFFLLLPCSLVFRLTLIRR